MQAIFEHLGCFRLQMILHEAMDAKVVISRFEPLLTLGVWVKHGKNLSFGQG